jgi:hypothetical protein
MGTIPIKNMEFSLLENALEGQITPALRCRVMKMTEAGDEVE